MSWVWVAMHPLKSAGQSAKTSCLPPLAKVYSSWPHLPASSSYRRVLHLFQPIYRLPWTGIRSPPSTWLEQFWPLITIHKHLITGPLDLLTDDASSRAPRTVLGLTTTLIYYPLVASLHNPATLNTQATCKFTTCTRENSRVISREVRHDL